MFVPHFPPIFVHFHGFGVCVGVFGFRRPVSIFNGKYRSKTVNSINYPLLYNNTVEIIRNPYIHIIGT